MNPNNHILIDKMTLAVDLASEDVKKLNGVSPIEEEVNGVIKYTEEAQDYFNEKYDYYMDMIETAKV